MPLHGAVVACWVAHPIGWDEGDLEDFARTKMYFFLKGVFLRECILLPFYA
jgi:hypothetical protein